MQAHKLQLMLLMMAGLLISYALVPGKQEQALMFLRDRHFVEAEMLYRQAQQESVVKRDNLVPLTRIYKGKGEIELAISMHEHYLAKHPEDIEVWGKLAELYRETQRPYDYINVLEQIVQKTPSLKLYEQLINLYDLAGIKDRRLQTVLSKIVELDPSREHDRRDLILLLARSGQSEQASMHLAQYAARFFETMDNDLAELRLRLFLVTGQVTDAFQWAEQWLDKHQDVSFRYMALLYSGGVKSDLNAALDTVAAVDPATMPGWLVNAVMKAGWDSSKIKFLESFVLRLDGAVVKEYPVIMARLALKQNNTRQLRRWLRAAEKKHDLSVHQQLHLMMVYLMSGRNSRGLALLSKLAKQTAIADADLVQAVPLILKTDYIDEALSIFNSLREHRLELSIHEAWVLLAASAGKTEAVSGWLDQKKDIKLSRRLLMDLYYAGADRSNFELAAIIGRRLYGQYKTMDEARLLISALLGMSQNTPQVNPELIDLLQEQLAQGTLSREERRALAFVLLRVGGKQEATNEFQLLAEAEGPQGENVQQLLFIWGPVPGDHALDWLEKRSRQAPLTELAGWWQHLMQAGGGERVAGMMDAYIGVDIPTEAEDVLVHALTVTGGFVALDLQLRAQMSKTSDSIRLEQLAAIAGGAGLAETEQVIWQRLYELHASNNKANKALGIAAFNRGDIPTAEKYLAQVMRTSEGDWESNYYLAEIFAAESRRADAKQYYKKSLRFIESEAEPNKRKQIARAYLLYRLGDTEQAMTSYEVLIDAYPDDPELRAEYSALLIDEGQLEKVGLLLGEMK